MKKCPGCGSSKITQTFEGIKCQKCGYINKSKVKVQEIERIDFKISDEDSLAN